MATGFDPRSIESMFAQGGQPGFDDPRLSERGTEDPFVPTPGMGERLLEAAVKLISLPSKIYGAARQTPQHRAERLASSRDDDVTRGVLGGKNFDRSQSGFKDLASALTLGLVPGSPTQLDPEKLSPGAQARFQQKSDLEQALMTAKRPEEF